MELLGWWFVIWWIILFVFGIILLSYLKKQRGYKIFYSLVVLWSLLVVLWYLALPTILYRTWNVQKISHPVVSEHFPLLNQYVLIKSETHNASAHWLFTVIQSTIYTQKTYKESTSEMLVWVSAHEVGHMIYWHMLWKITIFLIGILGALHFFEYFGKNKNILYTKYIVLIFLSIIFLMLYCQSARIMERQADQYAFDIWHGKWLTNYFELVNQWENNSLYTTTYPARLFRLHDPLDERIILLRERD